MACARGRALLARPTSPGCPFLPMPVARLRTAGVEPATQAQPPPCRRPAAAAPAPALLSVEAVRGEPAGGSGDACSQAPAGGVTTICLRPYFTTRGDVACVSRELILLCS